MPDVDPDRSAYDLFAIYGALMQQVQIYELLLATLALIVEADPQRVSNASLERQLQNAIRKGVHAFQRGSPSHSRDRIEGRVSEQLFSEVSELVDERNRLAHAFLVQQLDGDAAPPRFRRGTALQIIQYAQRFGAVNTKLDAEIRARAAALPDSPEQIGELIERLARLPSAPIPPSLTDKVPLRLTKRVTQDFRSGFVPSGVPSRFGLARIRLCSAPEGCRSG